MEIDTFSCWNIYSIYSENCNEHLWDMSSWSMWVNRSFDKECYIPELLWMGMRHGINLASLACASQSSLILPSLHNPSLGKDELNQHHLLRAEDNSGYDGLDRVGLRHVSLLAPGILHQFLWVRFLSGCVRFGLAFMVAFQNWFNLSVTEERDARDVRHGTRRKVEETRASRSSSKETLVGDHEDGQASARRRLSELEGIERLVWGHGSDLGDSES